jgi:hypothetical protein
LTLSDSIAIQIAEGQSLPFILPIQYPEGHIRRIIQETMKARKERAEGRGSEWDWCLKSIPLERFAERPEGPVRLFGIQVTSPSNTGRTKSTSPISQEILATIQPPEPDISQSEDLVATLYGN